jgi:hypothetical protein
MLVILTQDVEAGDHNLWPVCVTEVQGHTELYNSKTLPHKKQNKNTYISLHKYMHVLKSSFFFPHGAGDRTKSLAYAKQMLHHCGSSPAESSNIVVLVDYQK